MTRKKTRILVMLLSVVCLLSVTCLCFAETRASYVTSIHRELRPTLEYLGVLLTVAVASRHQSPYFLAAAGSNIANLFCC